MSIPKIKRVNRKEPIGQPLCKKKKNCYWGMITQKGGKMEYCCGFLYLNRGLLPCNRGRVGQDCPQFYPRTKGMRRKHSNNTLICGSEAERKSD